MLLDSFLGKSIPQDIIDQLKVTERIKFPLKPTTVSAISTSAQSPDLSPLSLGEVQKDLDNKIKDVQYLETLVEQLEELLDEHLKDMSIPPLNDMISSAAKTLGSQDGNITQPVLNTALAIADYFPIMSLGQDPVLGALTGNGNIDGNWMKCDQITADLAKDFTLPTSSTYNAEDNIPSQQMNMVNQHNQRLDQMIIQMLLMLWWNQLWAKFIVDLTIINPLRLMVADPIDCLIGFFQAGSDPKGSPFTVKDKAWAEGDGQSSKGNGVLNKLVTRLRIVLLCQLPSLMWSGYTPPKDIDCSKVQGCPPKGTKNSVNPGSNLSQLGDIANTANQPPCFEAADTVGNVSKIAPTGLGASPDCVKAATIVLDAVLADALTTKGIASAASDLAEQNIGVGL